MTGLWQAILDYGPAKAPSFEAFAGDCLDRHILATIERPTP